MSLSQKHVVVIAKSQHNLCSVVRRLCPKHCFVHFVLTFPTNCNLVENMAHVGDVGADGLLKGAGVLSRPADEFVNDETVEAMWAMKAFKHAEIYFNLLSSVDPKLLRLTPQDDAIYKAFRGTFPDLKIDIIDENEVKSPSGKEMWRPFCEQFKEEVEDYSFGTLVRLNCNDEFSQENTTLVPRIQFYAIEIARNREGFNDGIREKFRNKD